MSKNVDAGIVSIELDKLERDPKNVRRTYSAESIAALAANLRSDGFQPLQNLVIRKSTNKGKFFVVAGERRRLALVSLADAGEIAADFAVLCKERLEQDAISISLAENAMREEMHPADQFDAFQSLVNEGMHISDIAVRFAVTEAIVKQRLALSRIAAELLALYRAGELEYSSLKVFTICDDHEKQMAVWNDLSEWSRNNPHIINRALTENLIAFSDARFDFFGGVDVYLNAGGSYKQDVTGVIAPRSV
ncbi:ParB/RepB/Spo0J family partition protein [Brucella sp. H1_1004]|uniref:ParB/RepB/Spo0J family partition protein n=1 Tax=Brucella sp. H1_1004 TaxID=3110109 RepID=UPI0039B57C73